MTTHALVQLAVYVGILFVVTKPLGLYLVRVFEGRPAWLERGLYRWVGVDPDSEQTWLQYAGAWLMFSAAGFVAAYGLQRFQGVLPFNPVHFGTHLAPGYATPVSASLAANTAVSFVTNTNWQAYAGETTYSHFVQMAALTTQNFVSAAAGVALAVALIRGFARERAKTIGNFWVDVTRATLYIFLPLSVAGALFLCAQGAVQSLHGPVVATTLEGARQVIPQGPVASQEAIKMVGTNGGGFFNANSAHPYENPTPLTNFVEMLMIFAVPAGLTYAFGVMVGDRRQGWALWAAMGVLFVTGTLIVMHAELAGGSMEGKEVRFGIPGSAMFATITTDASCGAVNAAHDSLMPLSDLVLMFNMQIGEVAFGGVGAGLKGMLLFAILAVFLAGLMVGRTPEYLGKKIEQREVKMAILALLAAAVGILVLTAASTGLPSTAQQLGNPGPHGFSELLYAYTSATANNGSAMAGLNVNTLWFNWSTALAMFIGRFLFLLPLLAAAGSLAAKPKVPRGSGTLPTHDAMFVWLLVATVVIVGALTFFPALALGPVAEALRLHV